MDDSMDSYRSRFQYRSRSPNYFHRDHQSLQTKFLRLRHSRQHPMKRKTVSHRKFDPTPITTPLSIPLNHHNRAFSYDDHLLPQDASRLSGLLDLDSSAPKSDLDDIIGRLTSRCSLDSYSYDHFPAHQPHPTPDHRPLQRSQSVSAPIERRVTTVHFETPLEAGQITRQSLNHEFPGKNLTIHPQQSFSVIHEQTDKANHEGNSNLKSRNSGGCNADDIGEKAQEDGKRKERESPFENNLTPGQQQDVVSDLKSVWSTTNWLDDTTGLDEEEQKDGERIGLHIKRLVDNPIIWINKTSSSLDQVNASPPVDKSSVVDPLHSVASPSNANATLSPNHIPSQGILGQLISDSFLKSLTSSTRCYHHPLQPNYSSISSTVTTSSPCHPSSDNSADLPPQAYPGKPSPLLPPPPPSSKPSYQICFPRPSRRKLAVVQPSTVPLPASPLPEFDFSSFENSLDLVSCNLLDDSPCMPLSEKPFNESDPLIDFAVDDVIPATHLAHNKISSPMKHVPTRTTNSRFTPLPSPVISERFLLSSPVSLASTYVPLRFRAGHHEISQKLEKAIRAKLEASTSTPSASRLPPSDSLALGRTQSIAVDQPPNSPQQTRSPERCLPRPLSQAACQEPTSAIGSFVKNSRSRHASLNPSSSHTRSTKSGVEPLTEEALHQHSWNDRSESGNHCGIARSRAAPASDRQFSRLPTDVGSCMSRRTSKDAELESLKEAGVQRKAQRTEELLQSRREAEKYLTEQARDFDAISNMVHELKEMRERELGDLAGDVIGSQVSPASPLYSPLFGSPNPELPAIHSRQHSTYGSRAHSQAPMMGDMATNLREASVAGNVQAEALIERIRASSRATSKRSSVKAPSIAEVIAPSNQDTAKPSKREANSDSRSNASNGASVARRLRASSRVGTTKSESTVNAPQGVVEVLSTAQISKAPSAMSGASSRRQSVAHSFRQSSNAASNHSRSGSLSDQLAKVENINYSQSVTRSLHPPSVVASLNREPGSPVPAEPGTTRAASHAGSNRDLSNAKGSRATSIARSTQAQSNSGHASAPKETDNLRASAAASIPASTRAPSTVGSRRPPNVGGGSPQPPSSAGGRPPTDGEGSPQAPSSARDDRPTTHVGGSPRAPSNTGGDPTPNNDEGSPRAPSNTGGDPTPNNGEGNPRAPSNIGGDPTPSSGGRSTRAPSNTGGDSTPNNGGRSPRAPSNIGGDSTPNNGGRSPRASSNVGGDSTPNNGGRSPRAPSNTGGGPTSNNGRGSLRDPSKVGSVRSASHAGGDLTSMNDGNARVPSNTGNYAAPSDAGGDPPSVKDGSAYSHAGNSGTRSDAGGGPPSVKDENAHASSNAGNSGTRSDAGGGPPSVKDENAHASSNVGNSGTPSNAGGGPPSVKDENAHASSNVGNSGTPSNAGGGPPSVKDGNAHASSNVGNSETPSNAGGGPPSVKDGNAHASSNVGNSETPSNAGGGPPSVKDGNVQALTNAGSTRAPSNAGSKRTLSAGASRAPTVVGTNRPLTESRSTRGPSQIIQPDAGDVRSEAITSKGAESVKPPSLSAQNIKAASIALADGIVASHKSGSANGGTGQAGENGGNATENAVAQADGNEGRDTASQAPAENPAAELSSRGSKAGDIIGGPEISSEPMDNLDNNKNDRRIYPGFTNPLGEWIRFGRAGFRFHIITAHPDIYSPIPE